MAERNASWRKQSVVLDLPTRRGKLLIVRAGMKYFLVKADG
jgi:hypothetical protein